MPLFVISAAIFNDTPPAIFAAIFEFQRFSPFSSSSPGFTPSSISAASHFACSPLIFAF